MKWDWGALSPLAIYGAVLSTSIAVRDYFRARQRVTVRAGYAMVPGISASEFALVGVIANHGRDSIFLQSATVEVKGAMLASTRQPASMLQFPYELKAGQSFTASFSAEFVQSIAAYGNHNLVRVILHDQLGRSHRSQFTKPGRIEASEGGNRQLRFSDKPTTWRHKLLRRRRTPESMQREISGSAGLSR